MTNAEYERLYAVGDILRHIRNAQLYMKRLGHLEDAQLDKIRHAIDRLQDTYNTLEEANQ